VNTAGRTSIALWGVLLAACLWIVIHAHYTTDLSAFLPRSPTQTQQILVDQLREGVVSQLLLVKISNAPAEELAAVSNDLVKRLDNGKEFVYVNNGAAERFLEDGKILFQQRYLLSAGVTPERFTIDGLRAALEDDLDMLSSSYSGVIGQTLAADPTGELMQLLNQFQPQGGPQKKSGLWFTRDGSGALLILQTRAAGFDLAAQQAALTSLQQQFSQSIQQHRVPDAKLVVSGPGVMALSAQQAMKHDVSSISLFALLLVSLLLLVVYRSLRVLILTLLPVASGVIVGIAVVSLAFGYVHGVTLGFGSTLLGEGVDYAIYLFTQQTGVSTTAKSSRLWHTLRLGVATSAIGYGVLLMSDFSGLAQLGLFSVAGLVVAFTVTRMILPRMIPTSFSATAAAQLGPVSLRVADALRVLRWPLLALTLVASISLFTHGKLWDDRLESLSPVSARDKQVDTALRAELGAPDVGSMVVVRAPSEQAALQKAEEVGSKLEMLQQDQVLRGYESPALIMPSEKLQRQRQSVLPDTKTLQRNLQQASAGLPYQQGLFAPFIHDVEAARNAPLVTQKDLQGTSFGLKVQSLLVHRHDAWFALLPLRGLADANRLSQALAGMQDVRLLNLKQETDQLYTEYRHQALKFIVAGAVMVIILLMFALRSISRLFEVLLPLTMSVVITMALMVWGGHQLTMFHLIGLMLVVGVGSNYTLFFERHTFASIDPGRTLVSVILCNVATVVGFGMLAFARAPVLSSIGLTVAVGTFLCLLVAISFRHRASSAKEPAVSSG